MADENLGTFRQSHSGGNSGAVLERGLRSLAHASTACRRGDGDVTRDSSSGARPSPRFTALVTCHRHCIGCRVISGCILGEMMHLRDQQAE